MAARTGDIWGERTPYSPGQAWPIRVDLHLVEGLMPEDIDSWVPSACLLCSNGCGLDIAVKDGRMFGVAGEPRIGSITAASDPRGCTAGRDSSMID
jgi:anaerobic selenocysteine-containing dehydrogenase